MVKDMDVVLVVVGQHMSLLTCVGFGAKGSVSQSLLVNFEAVHSHLLHTLVNRDSGICVLILRVECPCWSFCYSVDCFRSNRSNVAMVRFVAYPRSRSLGAYFFADA